MSKIMTYEELKGYAKVKYGFLFAIQLEIWTKNKTFWNKNPILDWARIRGR